jgi:RNA polymerase sigma factor (sigma-70 family)
MGTSATVVSTGRIDRSGMIDWERVVREDGPAAWRTACRILGDREDAQECVQDAFAEAIELSRREPIQNCRALLLRVVTARSLDRLRRRYRRRAVELTEDCPLSDHGPQPEQHAQDAELLDRLRKALPDLPPQQSQAFVLHCVEDWSYQQIAEHLGVSVGAVGMLLLRARARLKELLAPSLKGENA